MHSEWFDLHPNFAITKSGHTSFFSIKHREVCNTGEKLFFGLHYPGLSIFWNSWNARIISSDNSVSVELGCIVANADNLRRNASRHNTILNGNRNINKLLCHSINQERHLNIWNRVMGIWENRRRWQFRTYRNGIDIGIAKHFHWKGEEDIDSVELILLIKYLLLINVIYSNYTIMKTSPFQKRSRTSSCLDLRTFKSASTETGRQYQTDLFSGLYKGKNIS